MLRSKIERSLKDRPEFPAQTLEVRCNYEGGHGYGSWLSIYRSCWKSYEAGATKWEADGRVAIVLECQKNGPADWWYSIKLPLQESELANAGDRLRFTETKNIDEGWSAFGTRGWAWVDDRYRNWATLMPELAQECKDAGGDICDYYVRTVVQLVVYAIPHIDKIESVSEP